jgi:uridine phosphorylase
VSEDPEAPDDRPVLTAAALLAHRRAAGTAPDIEPPDTVVLCYSSALLAHVARRYASRAVRGLFGKALVLKRARRSTVVVGQFGVGAPATAVLVEDLVALGAGRFVAVGVAGGIATDRRVGDAVVVDSAIRDEGTSRHYLPPGFDVAASAAVVAELTQLLATGERRPVVGRTWTTDAPYRERRGDVRRHQENGVQTVEMEAAALFAVAAALGVSAGAVLVVADTLSGDGWRLDADSTFIERRLAETFDAIVAPLFG